MSGRILENRVDSCERISAIGYLSGALVAFAIIAATSSVAFAGEYAVSGTYNQGLYPAIDGQKIVWIGCSGSYPDCDVYVHDLGTGTETKISTGGRASIGPFGGLSVSGNRIVWADNRNTADANDIWMFTLPSGPETRLHTYNSEQYDPDVDGDYVVFQSSSGSDLPLPGIYLYHITTNTHTPFKVTVPGPGDDIYYSNPSISGNFVVYEEHVYTGPTIHSAIRVDNLTGSSPRLIAMAVNSQGFRDPDISGTKIVYTYETSGVCDVFMYDLNWPSGAVPTKITTSDSSCPKESPAISGDRIVWTDFRNGQPQIYMYDLVKKVETKISNALIFAESPATSGSRTVWVNEAVSGQQQVFLYDPSSDPPSATMTQPGDGAVGVPVNTTIVVHVKDGVSGVDQGTIVMRVNGVLVNPVITGGPLDYTLTYDPPSDFGNNQTETVTIAASDLAGNAMSPASFTFKTASSSGNPWVTADDDGDGIPNGEEQNLLHTDPFKKTFFVRPKRQVGVQYQYWGEFATLFPYAGKPGFADIPAFTHAGIEIVIIGDPSNPYGPMQGTQGFAYDPATDSAKPHCDILEVVYKPNTSYCTWGSHNQGHTYFDSTGVVWTWDTKGYTKNDQTTSQYVKYNYYTAEVYPFPLDNYFSEGAYLSIEVGASPQAGSSCTWSQCYDVDKASPMNLNDADPAPNPPYTLSASSEPVGQRTVEFNAITFDASTKAITSVGAKGQGYDRETVLRRTIAHEMGHALLSAAEADHCDDPNCLMCQFVLEWKTYTSQGWQLHDFGPGNCIHRAWGGKGDVRANGVIHNKTH